MRARTAASRSTNRSQVSTDRLIDELWPEEPPATAAHTIQVYVSNLRKVLGAETWHTTPEEFRDLSRRETEKWAKVIKDAGDYTDC